MIIWGSKAVTGLNGGGHFNCPVCAQATVYEMKRVRRFFTLYFIPLFPTSTLGEYVECRSCQGTFEPSILAYDPSVEAKKVEALFMTAVKQIMIGVCLADGEIDDEEVKKIQEIYQELTGAVISETDLREEIIAFRGTGMDLLAMAQSLAPQLNDKGKETAIRSAYLIAAADGHVDEQEMDLIQRLGFSFGMTPAHLQGVLSTVSA